MDEGRRGRNEEDRETTRQTRGNPRRNGEDVALIVEPSVDISGIGETKRK